MTPRLHRVTRRATVRLRSTPSYAVAVLSAVWLALACLSVAPAVAEDVNACAVVSAADIQSALGIGPGTDGKRVDIGIRHTCDWKLTNGANLRLAIFTSPKAETLSSAWGPGGWYSVPGLGRQAGYRHVDFAPGVVSEEVQVILAQRTFFVQVTGHADQMRGEQPMIALARKVAERV